MRKRLIRWYYTRRVDKAYKILQSVYKRHKDAGHEVYLRRDNEESINLTCVQCPEFIPLKRKPEDVTHASVDRFGKPM